MKILALVLLMLSGLTHAKAKFPEDVALLIDRIQDCNHFAGEEPYNEERALEIKKAFKLLRCRSLKKDKEALLKKYRGNGEIVKAIEFAE